MVVPVAKLHCSKKLRISIMTVQLLRKDWYHWYHRHIVIIQYFPFWFGMGYPTTLSLFLMLRLITSPIIMWSRRDKEHSCLTLLDKEKGVERKPLLEIIDSVFWYSFLMNLRKFQIILIFALFGIRTFCQLYQMLFLDLQRLKKS